MAVTGLILLPLLLISIASGVQECGLQKAYTVQTVINGNTAASGQFPWTVSLFRESDYKCGGTILDNMHVLTAAHCVKPFRTENIRIYFGRYNLGDKRENTWIVRNVSEAFMHEDYGKNPGNHDADIAVLKVSKPIMFTDKIQPICLPESGENLNDVVGTVVGYGQNKVADQHEDIPRYIEGIETIELASCTLSDSRYFYLASLRTFCAGGMGKGPCRGDSGGGFLMKSKSTNRWTLYGIIAASLYDPLLDTCDVDKYAVYTNIFIFLDWIKTITGIESIRVQELIRGEKENKELLHLSETRSFYIFKPFMSTAIDTKTSEIESDRDDKVTAIRAEYMSTISHLPVNVAEVFPKLLHYQVYACSVTEVSRQNLKNLNKLEHLDLSYNKISSIDKDSFVDLHELKVLWFRGNQLTSLHEDTFSNNRKLQELDLQENKFESFPPKLLQNLSELKEIAINRNKLRTLDGSFFSHNLKLEIIWLGENQIEGFSTRTFSGLKKLRFIDLNGNKCIIKTYGRDDDGKTHEDLSRFLPDVARQCSQTPV